LITHIFRKDWKLLWPLVCLVTVFQVLLGWLAFKWGYFGDDLAARTLYPALTFAWYVGIVALVVAVVHQDPIPGISQDWLIRPVARRDLLFAKLLFVVATISGPMLVVDLLNAQGAGFTLSQALGPAAFKEIYVLLTLVVPLLALASVTENWPQVVIGAAVLMVLFALLLLAASFMLGPDRCPTCGTGLRWIQSLIQHAAVLLGAILILRLQYFQRRTAASRWLIAAGVILFACVQLPWNLAFAIQERLSAAPADAAGVALEFDAAAAQAVTAPSQTAPDVGAARAARELLSGNASAASAYLRQRAHANAPPVALELPVRVTGVTGAALLNVDRVAVRLLAADGRLLYHFANGGELAGLHIGDGAAASRQSLELPAALYRDWAEQPVRFEITYSLALLRATATYAMPATTGDLRAPELGRCQSQLKTDASEINLRCRQVGLGPPCYTVTLESPSGQHDPQSRDCTPDYRPFSALWSAPLSFFGIDVPVRDTTGLVQYPIARAELPESRLVMTTYSVRDHFTRTLVTPALQLAQWQARP